jgi:hypothetical protein
MNCMAKALGFAVLVLGACSPFSGASQFVCDSNEDCQGALDGRCESTGFCSFPDGECPDGRRYGELSGSFSGQCVGTTPPPVDAPDAPLPEAGEACFGDPNGFARPCFAMPPSMPVTLTGPVDTDGAMCATVSNTQACVIAGTIVSIPAGAVVTVSGSKPLVLLATQTLTIDGTLDAASKLVGGAIGAAANDAGCNAGTLPGTLGGGAGGSFGAAGGNGGNPNGGTAGAAAPPTALRGGCRGQDGSEQVANTRGIGGNGGGALYLIAETSIAIGVTGVINASGAGGGNGQSNLAGGGGGGSGGLIGFDSPSVTNAGLVFANGGGGGEGSGNATAGRAGSDPTNASPAAGGAGLSGNGGDGGNGGAGATGIGSPGIQASDGGGGGGGVGAIRVFRGSPAIGGQVSPPPS